MSSNDWLFKMIMQSLFKEELQFYLSLKSYHNTTIQKYCSAQNYIIEFICMFVCVYWVTLSVPETGKVFQNSLFIKVLVFSIIRIFHMQFHIEMFHIENATKFATLEKMEEIY